MHNFTVTRAQLYLLATYSSFHQCLYTQDVTGGNGPDFGRLFLKLNYTEKPQNNYIQS